MKPRFQRSFRFSLRTLFVRMTFVGVGLGYLGIVWQRVQRQRQIVAKIQAAGGTVDYDYEAHCLARADAEETHPERTTLSFDKTKDGRRILTRKSSAGVKTYIEQPPGPWILRRVIGDDAMSHVECVDFTWDWEVKDRKPFEPKLFCELPRLKVVGLRDAQVNDEWLRCIAQLPLLESLSLTGGEAGTATADGMAQLGIARHLRRLGLAGDWATDDAVRPIAKLQQLQHFELYKTPNITSGVFSSIGSLHELRALEILMAANVGDDGTKHLRNLKKLRSLMLRGTAITDASLANIAELTELQILDLGQSAVGDDGLQHLANLPNFQRLNLNYNRLGDAGVLSIARLKKVYYLDLSGNKITDAGLETIGTMSQLKELHLMNLNVTDAGIKHLRSLTNLKELDIGPGISVAAAEDLRQALPQCELRRYKKNGIASWPDQDDDEQAIE